MVTSLTPSSSSNRTRTRSPVGWGYLTHMVGPDRQLPVPAVDQHGQPDRARPAEVAQRVQGRTHRTPGVEDIVNQHHYAVVDRREHVGGGDGPGRLPPQVVAVHHHVEGAHRDVGSSTAAIAAANRWASVTAGGDTQEDQALGTPVGLEDLVGHARAGPGDLVRVEHQAAGVGHPGGRIGNGKSVAPDPVSDTRTSSSRATAPPRDRLPALS